MERPKKVFGMTFISHDQTSEVAAARQKASRFFSAAGIASTDV
jgi:hypothetical protein